MEQLYADAKDSAVEVEAAVYKLLLRKIWRQISRPERRLFILMYFRLPGLNRRIAAHEGVIVSFYSGMDKSTKALILLWLVFRVRKWRGLEVNGPELHRRWRAYLRFRRPWEEIVRDEEAEHKRTFNDPNRRETLDAPLRGKRRRAYGLGTREEADPDDLAQKVFALQVGKVDAWTDSYCTAQQRHYIHERFVEERSETEIANDQGVSQQAVSKVIIAGLRRIRKGLERDMGIGPEDS